MRVVCLLLAGAAMLGAQVVEGTVTNSVTRIGVSDVQVRLTWPIQPGPNGSPPPPQDVADFERGPHEAITDVAGKFRMEGLPDGPYNVSWFREGYIEALPAATRVEVKAGDPLKLELKMVPLGRVTGRVLDGKGHPVPDAKVELSGNSQRMTDENGEFAMEIVGSGTFTLMAYPPNEWDPPEPVEGNEQTWAPTYYPGIIHADAAARIYMAPGGEVSGLEIKLLAVPVRHVSGVVLSPDGKPVPDAAVNLSVGFGRQTNQPRTLTDENGNFDLATVDGNYRVIGEMTGEDGNLQGEIAVPVSEKDVTDLKLPLRAPLKVQGTLTYDPPAPPGTAVSTSITLLDGDSRSGGIRMTSRMAGETFTLSGIYPGTYRLLPNEPAPPYYLASVRVSGQDAMAGPVYLGSTVEFAEIVFRADGGTVSGTVEDCKKGIVSLIPVEQNLWKPGPRTNRCDAFGHFTITAVRPGDYYAIAIAPPDFGGPPLELTMPNLKPALTLEFLKLGSRVSVKSGESTHVDLKLAELAEPRQ